MTPAAFGAQVLGWHDFFLASAGATAALLGLLFVGVSINLGSIAAEERVDLRARTGQAFVNLIFVLVISLIMLIPDPDPVLIAEGLGVVAVFALYRVVQNLYALFRERERVHDWRPTLRRIGWTVIADAVLAFTAWRIWDSNGSAAVLTNLVIVVFVLLIGAADIAWEMLTEVSRERDRAQADDASAGDSVGVAAGDSGGASAGDSVGVAARPSGAEGVRKRK